MQKPKKIKRSALEKTRTVLGEKIRESAVSVLPILVIVVILCLCIVPMRTDLLLTFLIGALLLTVGMGLFSLGAEQSMTLIGSRIGTALTKTKNLPLILGVSFLLGFAITVAEPDLQVLADQVASIPSRLLIWAVALGVGAFLVLAVIRIYKKIRLSLVLIVLYTALFLLSIAAPDSFTAVAFDAGGVTTGPMTVPFIMALGVGLSAMRSDKESSSDSFGLIALCSVGPIMMVIILGICFNPGEAVYEVAQIPQVETSRDVLTLFIKTFPGYAKEVAISILPVAALFYVFSLVTHYYRLHEIKKMTVGFLYTYIGLVMFLTGVNFGFAPVGQSIGHVIAEGEYKWLLIPIGAIIGYYIVQAEPAVHVLNNQVEEITGGTVTKKMMNLALSASVACAVALSMARVVYDVRKRSNGQTPLAYNMIECF